MKSRRAVVVFKNSIGHWLGPLLKDGFRHVGVAIESENYWVFVDPNPDGVRFKVPALINYDIAEYFRNQGFAVVETRAYDCEIKVPLVVSNCVGVVKTVLGIRKFLIITPYQLYKFLRRREC